MNAFWPLNYRCLPLILPHPLAIHNQLAFRIPTRYNDDMTKHITKIDDIEDEVVRAIANLSLRKFFNGDEAELVKSFNQHVDDKSKAISSFDELRRPIEVNLKFPHQ